MKILAALILLVGAGAVSAQGITHWDVKMNNLEGLSPSATRKFLAKAVALKAGDSFQTVTNSLGKPDMDTAVGGTAAEPANRSLDYYLFRRKGATAADPSTKFVRVSLDFKTQRVHVIEINAQFQ